jgi:hypothetical protein
VSATNLSVVKNGVCRTTPIKSSLTNVPNYPKKLVIYQLQASPYWWVRYYSNGKILRKSTKETEKRKAIEAAKHFFDEVTLGKHLPQKHSAKVINTFNECASALLVAQQARLERGEITKITHENDEWRLKKHLLPHFDSKKLSDIDYFSIEEFLTKLTKEKLSTATLTSYLGLIKKVLSYGQIRGAIETLPRIPRVKREDSPRGWFTTKEYRRIAMGAKRLANKTYEVRSVKTEEDGAIKTKLITVPSTLKKKEGTLVRRVHISADLRNIIVFMTNAFIRPTDLKHLQHKHVEIVEDDERRYLRLSLPKSKKHDTPIVTMRYAVDVYLRQVALHYKTSTPNKNDYVFLPYQQNRDAALKDLQKQMAILLDDCGLRTGSKDEERSLYSLRHTCIMYRLLYGEGLDLLTLARNARTSPEMIDRFYARHLSAEMNVDILQSKRKRQRAVNRKDER